MQKNYVLLALCFPVFLIAQKNEGMITYEEIMNFEIELGEGMEQYAALIPTEQKTQMNLYFTENEALYKVAPTKDEAEENPFENDNGMTKVVINSSSSSEKYINQKEQIRLSAEDVMGKTFLVTSPITKQNWKITGDQKEILGYNCIKAERIEDSNQITAWFAPEIPMAIGPADFYGLPGLILSVELKGESVDLTIAAKEVKFEAVANKIKRPTKGKKVNHEDFEAIVEKQMAEMQEMMGGEGESSESGNTKVIIKVIDN